MLRPLLMESFFHVIPVGRIVKCVRCRQDHALISNEGAQELRGGIEPHSCRLPRGAVVVAAKDTFVQCHRQDK